MKQDVLYTFEKQVYIERTKSLIQSGEYAGLKVEELVILLQNEEARGR